MKIAPPRRAKGGETCLHACAAVAAACLFGGLLLLFNVGSMASLLAMSPAAAPVYLLGALTSFAPVVICTWALLLRTHGGRAT